jgi:hypothetical protein
MMQQTKTCQRCQRQNPASAASCYHCGSPFYEEDLGAISDSLARKGRMRIIGTWIFIAAFFSMIPLIVPGTPSPWFFALFMQLWIAAWFGLMLYVHAKSASKTPEGEVFRGPMPPGRAAFWTCFAAGGVFCIEYWAASHRFWLALGGALFCSLFIAGFALVLNWIGGEHGKAWARKYRRQILTVYGFVLVASAMLKLWYFLGSLTQRN